MVHAQDRLAPIVSARFAYLKPKYYSRLTRDSGLEEVECNSSDLQDIYFGAGSHSVKRSSLEQRGGGAWDWIERMETFLYR